LSAKLGKERFDLLEGGCKVGVPVADELRMRGERLLDPPAHSFCFADVGG
jgi:hypothetical protein